MRLVDLGLQAITAPTPSSRAAGAVALAALAGLAVLGAVKTFRNIAFFNIGNPDFSEIERAFVEDMAGHGIQVDLPLDDTATRVFTDWMIDHGMPEGDYFAAIHSKAPVGLVLHGRGQDDGPASRQRRLGEELLIEFHNVPGVSSVDAPVVVRRTLDELGYDAEAIVPTDTPWEAVNAYREDARPGQPTRFATISPRRVLGQIKTELTCNNTPGYWQQGNISRMYWTANSKPTEGVVILRVTNHTGALPRKVK